MKHKTKTITDEDNTAAQSAWRPGMEEKMTHKTQSTTDDLSEVTADQIKSRPVNKIPMMHKAKSTTEDLDPHAVMLVDSVAQTLLNVLRVTIKAARDDVWETCDEVPYAAKVGDLVRVAQFALANTEKGFTWPRWVKYVEKECGMSVELASCFILFAEERHDSPDSTWRQLNGTR